VLNSLKRRILEIVSSIDHPIRTGSAALSYALLSQVQNKHVEAANFAGSVLGTENMPAFPSDSWC
jgi:hypothetical protein